MYQRPLNCNGATVAEENYQEDGSGGRNRMGDRVGGGCAGELSKALRVAQDL